MTLTEIIRHYHTPEAENLVQIRPPPPTEVLISAKEPQSTVNNVNQHEITAD